MKLPTFAGRLAWMAPLLAALGLAGCASRLAPPGAAVPGQLSEATPPADAPPAKPPRPSTAITARDYKRDAARHIYELNGARIYGGKLPPLLYAIGTLQVHLDREGKVTALHWMRAPRHAPEVIAEIERTVLAASPFPAPEKLGPVTWTDTWLWDKGGRFQLDSFSEGQL